MSTIWAFILHPLVLCWLGFIFMANRVFVMMLPHSSKMQKIFKVATGFNSRLLCQTLILVLLSIFYSFFCFSNVFAMYAITALGTSYNLMIPR